MFDTAFMAAAVPAAAPAAAAAAGASHGVDATGLVLGATLRAHEHALVGLVKELVAGAPPPPYFASAVAARAAALRAALRGTGGAQDEAVAAAAAAAAKKRCEYYVPRAVGGLGTQGVSGRLGLGLVGAALRVASPSDGPFARSVLASLGGLLSVRPTGGLFTAWSPPPLVEEAMDTQLCAATSGWAEPNSDPCAVLDELGPLTWCTFRSAPRGPQVLLDVRLGPFVEVTSVRVHWVGAPPPGDVELWLTPLRGAPVLAATTAGTKPPPPAPAVSAAVAAAAVGAGDAVTLLLVRGVPARTLSTALSVRVAAPGGAPPLAVWRLAIGRAVAPPRAVAFKDTLWDLQSWLARAAGTGGPGGSPHACVAIERMVEFALSTAALSSVLLTASALLAAGPARLEFADGGSGGALARLFDAIGGGAPGTRPGEGAPAGDVGRALVVALGAACAAGTATPRRPGAGVLEIPFVVEVSPEALSCIASLLDAFASPGSGGVCTPVGGCDDGECARAMLGLLRANLGRLADARVDPDELGLARHRGGGGVAGAPPSPVAALSPMATPAAPSYARATAGETLAASLVRAAGSTDAGVAAEATAVLHAHVPLLMAVAPTTMTGLWTRLLAGTAGGGHEDRGAPGSAEVWPVCVCACVCVHVCACV